MANIGDVMLSVNADMTGFEGQVTKGAQKAGDKASAELSGRIKKGLSGNDLGNAFAQGLGIGGGLGAAKALEMGTRKVVDVIFDSIDAASNQREAMSLTTQVFEDQTAVIDKWATGAVDAFGQSKTEALNFASSFGGAFKTVGFSLDETTKKSMELTHLAADLGSAFNASSEEAATALRSGLMGESEPLRRFNVFLSEAAVDAELTRKGQHRLNGEWTNAQKVLARYQIIMDQTTDSQGMFGRDTESLADAQKSLQSEVTNLEAEFGEALVPVLTGLAKLIKEDVAPAVHDLIQETKDGKGPIADTANAFDDMGKQLDALSHGLNQNGRDIHHVLFDLLPHWKTTLDADYVATVAMTGALDGSGKALDDTARAARTVPKPLDRVAAATKGVGDAAHDTKKEIDDLRQSLLQEASDLIANYYDPIQMRQQLQANAAEYAAAKRVLASKTATDAEKRDARATITQVARDNDELRIKLLATGTMSKKEHDALVANLKSRLKTATGATKTYVQGLIDEVKRLDGMNADITITATLRALGFRGDNAQGGKASGGDVEAYQPTLVGERKPEIFVPQVPGHIYPDVGTGLAAWQSQMGGGGDTYNVHLDTLPPVRHVRDVGDHLRVLGQRGYIGRRRR